jgi:hypothetical protein
MMPLNPELKELIRNSKAQYMHLGPRHEIDRNEAADRNEDIDRYLAELGEHDECPASATERLVMLGLSKATKNELKDVLISVVSNERRV